MLSTGGRLHIHGTSCGPACAPPAEQCELAEPEAPELERWDVNTAVAGQTYSYLHPKYGEVTVRAIKEPSRDHCMLKLNCRCGCGMEAKKGVQYQGYAQACLKRLTTQANVAAARAAHGGVLPEYKGESKETAGTYCQKHGVEGQAVKHGAGKTMWRPFCACGECWRLTHSSGQKYARGCAFNARCTKVVDGVRCKSGQDHNGLCGQCYNRSKYPPCPTPGCTQTLVKNHTLCQTCERRAKTEAQRQTHLPALLKLVAAGARDGRKVDSWKAETNTVYVVHNLQDDHRPYLVLRCGKRWVPACVCRTDNGSVCPHKAQRGDDGTTTRCIQHGGGPRCIGSHRPGEDPVPCPYDMGVTPHYAYGRRCVRCFCYHDPSNALAIKARKAMHAKEQEVRLVLEAHFPHLKWTFDRHMRFAVGAARPDALTRTSTRVLIVEIDEYSHRAYACGKERVREELFAKHLAPFEIAMIRFNPDKYTDVATGITHPSCFKVSKGGGSVIVNPKHKTQWEARCAALVHAVTCCIDPTHPDYLTILPDPIDNRSLFSFELFYDDVSGITDAQKRASRAAMHRNAKRVREVLDDPDAKRAKVP